VPHVTLFWHHVLPWCACGSPMQTASVQHPGLFIRESRDVAEVLLPCDRARLADIRGARAVVVLADHRLTKGRVSIFTRPTVAPRCRPDASTAITSEPAASSLRYAVRPSGTCTYACTCAVHPAGLGLQVGAGSGSWSEWVSGQGSGDNCG